MDPRLFTLTSTVADVVPLLFVADTSNVNSIHELGRDCASHIETIGIDTVGVAVSDPDSDTVCPDI